MIEPAAGTYDNDFEVDNVYGHALELLVRHRLPTPAGGIYLDVGCGFGRIAEPLVAALGLKYVGCDADPAGLGSLKERGFEAHRVLLGEEEQTYVALRECVAGRPLLSISMLDTLEHLPDTSAILHALRRLSQDTGALVVVSVPNAAHFDIGAKLLLGRLDITDVGILDHTHMRVFNAKVFDRELRSTGLYPFDFNDTKRAIADQHFPAEHPLLTESTEIGGLLRSLRRLTDDEHADVLQLLRICSPGQSGAKPSYKEAYVREQRPFLTTVIRTRGRRTHTLRETLLCLHGQTDRDIELLVVGHRLDQDAIKRVERILDDQPEEMRKRTRLKLVGDGNRVRPLNVGFAEARGRYIAILDDDDVPMGHWVETFRKLDARSPGRLLRAACVRQDVETVKILGHQGLRAEGPPERPYTKVFDLFQHLRGNQSPPVCIAFPRGAFHDLGLQFDETLTTTEDWDYIMRVALLLGVESSAECTSVYRWWVRGKSSRTDHDQAEWTRNYYAILRKMDSSPVLLPPGSTERLRYLLDVSDSSQNTHGELTHLKSRIESLHEENLYFHRQVRDGTSVTFTENGDGSHFETGGWSSPETIGTWTDGPRATLTATLPDWPAQDMILQVVGQPFLVKDRHPSIEVVVVANGMDVDCWYYNVADDDRPVLRSALIPSSVLATSSDLRIEFKIRKPAAPAKMGLSADTRLLGLCVSRVSFLSENREIERTTHTRQIEDLSNENMQLKSRVEDLQRNLTNLNSAIKASFALRLTRLVPRSVRTIVRRTVSVPIKS